jgi:two-component system chemotaxis response regulator CheB
VTVTRPPSPLPAVDAVAIGASAGGIDALFTLFRGMHPGWRQPIVAVLHLPDDHESQLASLFAARLHVPAQEARPGEPLAGGTLYFAPAGYHLLVEADHTFALSQDPPVLFSRPSIDVLFESAADAYGERLAAFLLTGANADGAAGLAAVRASGGFTAVQDPDDAAHPTMPRAALDTFAPDAVLPLPGLQTLLASLLSR